MNIDNLTFKEIKHIQSLFQNSAESPHPFSVGKNYFIRTVTHHFTGKLAKVTATELVLTDAAWIADDGRFHTALATGQLNEIEPYPEGEVIIGRGALIDASVWNHPLPRHTK